MTSPIDELAFLFKQDDKSKTRVLFGKVLSASTESYSVLVDGAGTAMEALKGCTAKVNDRVLLILSESGLLIATSVVPSGHDTGWLTSGHSTYSDWTVDSIYYRRVGNLVSLYLVVTRANNELPAVASGNIPNEPILTLPSGFRPATGYAALAPASHGIMASGYIGTNGVVFINALPPNIAVGVGHQISLGGMYFSD